MEIIVTFALLATLAGNLCMLVRHWPALARALAGPGAMHGAPQRPPAEVIVLAARCARPVERPHAAPLRLAA